MGYYDNEVEDAIIVDDGQQVVKHTTGFDKDIIKKVSSIHNGHTSNLLEKTAISVKTGVVFTILALGYALYKGKSMIKFGIVGAVVGVAVGNLFGEQIIKLNKINKDEERKQDS